MKKVKYSPFGTNAKELNEHANQCRDEHEISVSLAIERYGLDKELFYTEEQNWAVAEFTLGREIRDKAKCLVEVLAGERMSDEEMKKSLESKERRKNANGENAKRTRKEMPSKADLENFKSDWAYKYGTDRGWIKSAACHYERDRKTISAIHKKNRE